MNLRDRARKLFGRDELSEHAVKASKVEHAVFNDLLKRAPGINDLVATPPENVDPQAWRRVSEDLWSEFYGMSEPTLRSRDKIDPRFHVNRQVADKNLRQDGFDDLRAKTAGQTVESALAIHGALNSLAASYGDELAEHAEQQKEIGHLEDTVDQLDDMLERLRELRNDGDPGGMTTEQIDADIRKLAEVKRSATDDLKAALTQQQQQSGALIDAAKQAMGKAMAAAADAAEVGGLLAGTSPGARQHLSADQALAFGDRVAKNRTLRQVLDMLGRMELSMGNVRRTLRKGGYEEMVDIENGNDLRVVLPAEKALLTHPIARLDFYRRFHERSLMQYEMWSEEELKKGPMIIAPDGSLSMAGDKNVFARGLSLASCLIGNKEGRNTAALEFGSEGELREFWFPGDKPFDMTIALDFAEHFFGGGTDINQVLLRAHDLIKNEAPFHSADLIIITDGVAPITESTYVLRDKLREMGVKIHGICIGIQPTQYIVETCDSFSSVFDFAGPNATSDRLAINLT